MINSFDIPSVVPQDGDISFSDIAKARNLEADILERILRQAMTYRVFTEPRAGYVAHTAASKVLLSLSDWIGHNLDTVLPSSTKLVEALQARTLSDGRGFKTPFNIAFETRETWWEYANKDSKMMQRYEKVLEQLTDGGSLGISLLVKGVYWELHGAATVVDVCSDRPWNRASWAYMNIGRRW